MVDCTFGSLEVIGPLAERVAMVPADLHLLQTVNLLEPRGEVDVVRQPHLAIPVGVDRL